MNQGYRLFFDFIDTFSPSGFIGIDRTHPLIQELERMMKVNNQFFGVLDTIQMKILFTSERSSQIIGIEPADVTPYHFFEATHPDDIKRHSKGRSILFKMAQDFYIAKKGIALLSTNLKLRNPLGKYSDLLFQCYLFYCKIPVETVYLLEIHTDIDWFKKIKHGYHYYMGYDLSLFRYPDEELLMMGNVFSEREFQIIKLVEEGLNSQQIADKLFLSRHTISTHRSNILNKLGKVQMSEVIYMLRENGLL
jgi:DNA-binding CsgD family transcriptional regulator